jgi:hypothetical protein
MSKDEDQSDKGFIWTAAIVTLAIIGLWGITYVSLKDLAPTERGTFGDMFGSINSLFSGLALAGIILTILLQRKELKLQRKELTETRQEFKIQNETLRLQRFENTFFNLLNLHHEIVNAIDFRYYKKKEKGGWVKRGTIDGEELEAVTITSRDVFRYRYNKFLEQLGKSSDHYLKVYMDNYEEAQTDFAHYFRNLYRMIKLVDETEFFLHKDDKEQFKTFNIKYKYTSMIRAQISDYELLWLFYNCLSQNGSKKFKPLIEKYSFLKNLPSDKLADKEHLFLYKEKMYDPTMK